MNSFFDPHSGALSSMVTSEIPSLMGQELVSGPKAIVQIAFAPDGQSWALGDAGMSITLMGSGGVVWRIDVTTSDPNAVARQRIRRMMFDSSGRVLVVALADRLAAFDAGSGAELWSYSPPNLFGFLVQGPSDIMFVGDDRVLVPFDDGSLSIWTLSGWMEWRRRMPVTPRMIAALPNGEFVGSDGCQTLVWSSPGSEFGYRPILERVYSLASLNEAPIVAIRTLDQLHIIDVIREQSLAVLDAEPGLPLIAASPKDSIFAVGAECSAKIVDTSGNVLATASTQSGARLTGLAFSSDGQTLALGDFDGEVSLMAVTNLGAAATGG